jgi:hypothetical protein
VTELESMTQEQRDARIKEILDEMLNDPQVRMKTRDRYELQLLLYGRIKQP